MQSLAGSTGFLRLRRVASVFSSLHRWWYPAFVRGDAPQISAASLRFKGDPFYSRFAMENHTMQKRWTQGYDTSEITLEKSGRAIMEGEQHILMGRGTKDSQSNPTSLMWRGTKDSESNPTRREVYEADGITHVLPNTNSSHRDGTLYKEKLYWKSYLVDITDRNERIIEHVEIMEDASCSGA